MNPALSWAVNRPWAIHEDTIQVLQDLNNRSLDIDAIQKQLGQPMENTYEVSVRDGIARIPIHGVISRKANLFIRVCGGVSTELLATDFGAAMANPDVKAVVFDIDSPGGEASGINELAKLITSYRGSKPIIAYGSGQVASGAYWIASAADKIVVDETAMLGSIGVVFTARKSKGEDEGIEIVSSISPKKRLDPATKEGRSELQVLADSLADVFVESVASNRGLEIKDVLSDFGQGGLLIGKSAVDRKMADELGSYESVVQALISNEEKAMDQEKLTAELTEVKAQLATAQARAELSDQEKEFMATLSDQASFLKLDKTARTKMIEQAASKDPVVYTALDGTTYRASDDARLVSAVKSSDELRKQVEDANKAAASAKATAWAKENLNHMTGKTEDLAPLAELALSNPAVAQTLKAANDTLGSQFKAAGTSATPKATGLTALVQEYQKLNPNVSIEEAYSAVLKTDEGQRLYGEGV